MWSFVGTKARAQWLWQSIDHHTGRVLAYYGGYPQGCGVLATPRLARAFWHHPELHGQGWCLSAVSSACAAHSGKADNAKDRAHAPHIADASETLDSQDAVFLPLALHARPPHRVIHEPD